jgi:hypothetical protein
MVGASEGTDGFISTVAVHPAATASASDQVTSDRGDSPRIPNDIGFPGTALNVEVYAG